MSLFRKKRTVNKRKGFKKREIKVINKPQYKNPYFQKKESGLVLRLLSNPKYIFLCLIIGGLVYLFFYSSFFQIDQIEIRGNQELTYDTIRYEINKQFIERRFFVFKESNLFIYDTADAKDKIWDTFVLDEISITKRFPNKLIVTIKEKIPNLTLITGKAFYYMDLEGVVTHVVPKDEIKKHFPKIEDLNDRVIKLKDKIVSKKIINAVFTIKDIFNSKTNANIDRFLIPDTSCSSINTEKENKDKEKQINTNSVINTNSKLNSNLNTNSAKFDEECDLVTAIQDIYVLTDEGWKAYFTINDDIESQLERLKVYLLKKALDKQSRENIEYIDLRFGEKIYILE